MEFITEAIVLFVKTVLLSLWEFCVALIESVPVFMELKEMLSYCAPQNAIALFLGIPTSAITLICLGAKLIATSARR